ncbi:MAG: signal peptide peptidase SppA [Candidatus Gastranaerophilales bacterium]|nr:signal peptide peptidase SppA [Candidatus Gastranaerophilales bacterium]
MFKKSLNKLKYTLFEDRRVALVKIEGIIIDMINFPMATRVIEAIEEVKKKEIKTMVLRINSPGGTVGASQEIFNAVKRIQKEGIKVVVSMGDVAASGGVYTAVAGDKIYSNPGTITGSIGVIIKTSVIKDLYQKIGVDHQIIKSGPYKDILSNIRYLTDEEKKLLQDMIDDTYNQFLTTVAENRKLDVEKVRDFADGRIFTGQQAKEFGLVDEIGSLADAVDEAAKLAEITGKPDLIDMSPKKSLWQKFANSSLAEVLENFGVSSSYSGIPLWLMIGI